MSNNFNEQLLKRLEEIREPDEQWRPHVHDSFYWVSSHGRIYSLRSGRILRDCDNGAGYRYVLISEKGSPVTWPVHVLVLAAFEGFPARPNAHFQACHIDGDRANNRLSNLRWQTRKENARDKIRHGTNGRKLQADDVHRLRAARDRSADELAAQFGVSAPYIRQIWRGKAWAGLPAAV